MIKLTEQTLFAERYLFTRLLGRGGFSEVWLATDKMTGLEIAVKVYAPGQGMDSDGMKDFCKELSQVYNLNHTNLLKPQHVDSWEGMPYLVMTYCPKGSCHRMIGSMTEDQIWKMLHDVSAGLAYLHEQGIIHQDIKPDNILIDPLGNYVITDFGISVQSRSTLRKSMNIASGSGTTAYMGPERFSADPTPLKASDIWSLGATAYELLTGNAPFGEIGGGMQKGGADLPTIKQYISSELRMVLAKMLSKETWDRPTAEQLVAWAKNPQQIVFSSGNIVNQEATNPNPVPKASTSAPVAPDNSNKGGKKSMIIGIVIAALLLLGGGAAWMFMRQGTNSQGGASAFSDEECIEKHIEISKNCANIIAELTQENILDKLDFVIEEMRGLEKFEKNGPCSQNLKKTFSQERMKSLMANLMRIKKYLEDYRDNTLKSQGYEKKGEMYRKCELKIERISEVLHDIEESENKSAEDIHISKDDINF